MSGAPMGSNKYSPKRSNGSRWRGFYFIATLLFATVSGWFFLLAQPKADQNSLSTAWETHIARCIEIPIIEYKKDRAKRVYGFVVTENGELPNTTVELIDLKAVVSEFDAPISEIVHREISVESSTTTDKNGFFEFKDISTGVKAVVATHSEYGQVSKAYVVVQNGYGTRADLEYVDKTKVRFHIPEEFRNNIEGFVIPANWTTTFPKIEIGDSSEIEMEFSGISRFSDLLLLVKNEQPIAYAILGAHAKDATLVTLRNPNEWRREVRGSLNWIAEQTSDLVQLKGRGDEKSNDLSRFYSFLSPVAAILADNVDERVDANSSCELRGYTVLPYSPVWISSWNGAFTEIAFADEAMEVRLKCEPGIYTVRTISWDGQTSYLKSVSPSNEQPISKVSFNRLESWGALIEKGRVTGRMDPSANPGQYEFIVQDAQNFRRFIKSLSIDEGGFELGGIPLNRSYVGFVNSKNSKTRQYRDFISFNLTDKKFEEFLILNYNDNHVVISGELLENQNLIARLQPEDPLPSKVLFEIDSLEIPFEMSNIPTTAPIRLELRDAESVLSSVHFGMTDDGIIKIEIENGEIVFRH